MNSTLEEIKHRLEKAEDQSNDLEEKVTENSQSEQKKKE